MPIKVIDNFGGRLTRYVNGDMNSGFAKYGVTFGADVFSKPRNLTWQETVIQIDPSGSVITDLIVAGKERVESGVSYVYAVGHTGRVYKIQVNDPATFNPNYDNPVLLATLTTNSPTFTRGGSIEFYGSTERIYIGHDMGVTQLDFNGTNETFVGVLGSWTQNVPRPLKPFLSSLYVGNGSNIAEITTGLVVGTYTKLNPGFPNNTQVRDMDVSVDGNYMEFVVTRLALGDITSVSVDTGSITNSDSYVFKWNGTDNGYTSFITYSSYSLTGNIVFGTKQFVFGYDTTGSGVYDPSDKVLSPVTTQAPMPNAIGTGTNLVGWIAPETNNFVLRGAQFIYGQADSEIPVGWWRQMAFNATSPETDVVRVPFATLVSNLNIGSSSNGYLVGIFGFGKYYFSTLETSSAPTTKYRFYKWFPVPTTLGTAMGGIYETQTELFPNKIDVSVVRIYGEPWVANNSFKIDLIGSNGNPITDGSITFTAAASDGAGKMIIGKDYAWWSPNIAPTYALGVRITNLGTVNHTIHKIEIDYEPAGH